MANTGYAWDANWTTLVNAVVLTQGGTITSTSSEVDLDTKAACLVAISATYSNHALATSGLSISVLRDYDDTLYETANGAALVFQMPFTQNAAERKAFFLSAEQFQKWVMKLDWGNTTGSSAVTITVNVKYSTIPAAS